MQAEIGGQEAIKASSPAIQDFDNPIRFLQIGDSHKSASLGGGTPGRSMIIIATLNKDADLTTIF